MLDVEFGCSNTREFLARDGAHREGGPHTAAAHITLLGEARRNGRWETWGQVAHYDWPGPGW